MGTIVFSVLITAVGIAVWFVAGIIAREDKQAIAARVTQSWSLRLAGVLALAVPLLSSYVIVPYGKSGVIVSFGRVFDVPFEAGFHPKAPWWSVTEQDVRMLVIEGDYECASSDQQSLKIGMKLNFRRKPQATPQLFNRVGAGLDSIKAKVIDPASQETLKAEIAQHKVADILLKRKLIKGNVQRDMAKWFERYDLELMEVSLAHVGFSKTYEDAIERKQVEEQRAMQFEYELKVADIKAEIEAIRGQGLADATAEEGRGRSEAVKIKATAEADAIQLVAEAEAEVNQKIGEQFNELMLARDYTMAWKGQVPRYNFSKDFLPMPAAVMETAKAAK
jgi:prohibitin 2